MKTRTFFIFSCAIFLLLTSCLGLFQLTPSLAASNTTQVATTTLTTSLSSTTTPTVTPSPTATATVTPSPAATSAPCTSGFCAFRDEVVSDVQALADLIALAFIIFLVPFLSWRIWKLWRASSLVVDSFNNATGDSGLDKVLTGLNQLTREELATCLEHVRVQINKKKEQLPASSSASPSSKNPLKEQFPVPETTSDTQITTLLASLQGITSPGPVQTVIALLSFILAPHGAKISTSLQTRGDTRATLGMSFEVSDLQNKQRSILHTFWEPGHTGQQTSTPSSLSPSTSPPQTPNVPADRTSQQATPRSAPPSLPFPQQKAHFYAEVGKMLAQMGIYAEAIHYFEEALKCDKQDTEGARALSESLSCLQVQQSKKSAYDTGKQLQDAGLSSAAIESYKQSVLSDGQDQDIAVHNWNIILPSHSHANSDRKAVATAYHTLAGLYRKPQVFLYDQSIDLYKAAIAHGSQQAATELAGIQQGNADLLTQIASILQGLTQYDAAEKYLLTALAKVPKHLKAKAALAALKQNEPPKEDKDALASYTLGHIYEDSGALNDALNQYKNALTKQPGYNDAKDALKHLLQTNQTPEDRLRQRVLPAAARWLAIEIALRTMEVDESSWTTRWKNFLVRVFRPSSVAQSQNRRRAMLYNFFGSFHQVGAQTFYQFPDYYDFFYKRAIEAFNQAIELDGRWFQPYENLAYTYVMVAQEEMVQRQRGPEQQWLVSPEPWQPTSRVRENLYQALTNYDKALDYFQRPGSNGSAQPRSNRGRPDALPETHPDRQVIVRRILIGQATPQLLLGDAGRAVNGIKTARYEIEGAGNRSEWILEDEKDIVLLYDLACWYAKADRQHTPITEVLAPDLTAKHAALRYVTYSMARDTPGGDLWNWIPRDTALSNISDAAGWERLALVLTQKIYELHLQGKEMSEMKGDEFKHEIEIIVPELQIK